MSKNERTTMSADFVRGVRAAADVAAQYNAESSHPYRIDDCILTKLNVGNRKPRKNLRAHDELLRGYAAALAAVQRMFDEPTIVSSVMSGDNVTIASLKRACVEPFDLDVIKGAMR